MSKILLKTARERIAKLTRQINELRFRYHVLDDPKITDEIYDSLTQELLTLEAKYPQLKAKNSPTTRVGGKALDKFVKVKHQSRMLSLTDAFDEQGVRDWEARLEKILPASPKTARFALAKARRASRGGPRGTRRLPPDSTRCQHVHRGGR